MDKMTNLKFLLDTLLLINFLLNIIIDILFLLNYKWKLVYTPLCDKRDFVYAFDFNVSGWNFTFQSHLTLKRTRFLSREMARGHVD